MKCYFLKLFSDPSFIGALFGALITGGIAIFIMKQNNNYYKKQEKKNELEPFLKESSFFLDSVKKLITEMQMYAKVQKEEECTTDRVDESGFPTEEISEIRFAKNLNKEDITETIFKLKSVNRNAFTRDTFDLYLNVLTVLENLEYYWKRSLENNASGVGEIIEEENRQLIMLKDSLEGKYEEKEKEYNHL